MRTSHIARGLALLALASVSAQAQTIAITGGTVYPVSGPKIEKGTVVIRDGKIIAVGANVAIPAGAKQIDATGKWVTPGLFNASTALGLSEGNAPAQSGGYNDARAKGEKGVAASFSAWMGMNPAATFIAQTRRDGVTSAVVWPAGGLLVSGRAAVVDLAGETVSAMTVRGPVAMLAEIGGGTESRAEVQGKLRELLADAKTFATRKAAYENGATREFAAPRAELEALQPVVSGKMPLAIDADRASDIRAALALAQEMGIKIVIVGGAEAWQVAKELSAAKVPVMVGAMNNIPTSFNTLGNRQENAAILRAAGVHVSLIGNAGGPGENNFNARNIRYEAGNAVAYGMSWEEALRAITLAPAETFGVADRLGSLQVGREGNVVVWSGDPFEFASQAEHVFVRGAESTGLTREEELTARYKNKPPTYRK